MATDQSYLLGQFVALTQLIEEVSNPDTGGLSEKLFTSEHLEPFLANIPQKLPIMLKEIETISELIKEKGKGAYLSEITEICHTFPDNTFENFELNQEVFLNGYYQQLGSYN